MTGLRKLLVLKAAGGESGGTVVERTVTGAVASFSTNMAAAVSALTAKIVQNQPGSGDPSPTNIRPISGYVGCTITVSPTTAAGSGTTYLADWDGTIYNGEVNVTAGTAVSSMGHARIGDYQWTYEPNYTRFSTTIAGIFHPGSARRTPFIASSFVSVDDGRPLSNVPDNAIYGNGANDTVYIKCTGCESSDELVETFGDQTFLYPLASVVDVQFTPVEVKTIKGQNNVWTDTGDVTVTYKVKE